MELWEAIKALQEGKKIRCEGWSEEAGYVCLDEHGCSVDELGKYYRFDPCDFTYKWELYEEPEKTPETPSLDSRIEALETQFSELESKIERRLRDEMSSSFRHIYNKFIKSTQESGCEKDCQKSKPMPIIDYSSFTEAQDQLTKKALRLEGATYNFMEAVQLCKQGNMVKRKGWEKDKFLVYEYAPFYRVICTSYNELILPGVIAEDIQATDWVVVGD